MKLSSDLFKKLIISAALAGAITKKSQNPNVPYTPEEFGEEAKKCLNAGASIVHIHARDPQDGSPTGDLEKIKTIIAAIKDKAPEVLINLSTAISPFGWTNEQRVAPVIEFKPPLASLNTNSMNFAGGNFKTGEIIQGNTTIFENTFEMILMAAKAMKNSGTRPEIEIYDFGGLHNILFLNKQEALFDHPLHFQLVFGVLGGVPFSPTAFGYMLSLLPEGSTYSVCGVAKDQFRAGFSAAVWGGHIRVGLEDNIRLVTGELAKGSYEQVEWAANVARMAGREVATPKDTRQILRLNN